MSALPIRSQCEAGAGLRDWLRAATSNDHDAIDTAFAAHRLDERDGYRLFLTAHAIAWQAVRAPWQQFVERKLGLAAPDYAAMLLADLADMGVGSPQLPGMVAPAIAADAGMAYVLAGSRLGIASIRRGPIWGIANRTASRFIDDRSGPAVFRALIAYLDGPAAIAIDRSAAARSAANTFALFHHALTLAEQTAEQAIA